MFFELVSRNSKRSRKENGLFFASLLVTIIAFYIILSLSEQDVMIFLAQMESDAVDRLLLMIPLLYGATLFILFFLIYFASKYQLERRKHEFGVYLMMGMSRSMTFPLEETGSSFCTAPDSSEKRSPFAAFSSYFFMGPKSTFMRTSPIIISNRDSK